MLLLFSFMKLWHPEVFHSYTFSFELGPHERVQFHSSEFPHWFTEFFLGVVQVKCWDLEYNKVIRHYHGHLSAVYSMSLHPTIDVLVTAGRDSTARVWDMRTKVRPLTFIRFIIEYSAYFSGLHVVALSIMKLSVKVYRWELDLIWIG